MQHSYLLLSLTCLGSFMLYVNRIPLLLGVKSWLFAITTIIILVAILVNYILTSTLYFNNLMQ